MELPLVEVGCAWEELRDEAEGGSGVCKSLGGEARQG